jgi:hypothetical protein
MPHCCCHRRHHRRRRRRRRRKSLLRSHGAAFSQQPGRDMAGDSPPPPRYGSSNGAAATAADAIAAGGPACATAATGPQPQPARSRRCGPRSGVCVDRPALASRRGTHGYAASLPPSTCRHTPQQPTTRSVTVCGHRCRRVLDTAILASSSSLASWGFMASSDVRPSFILRASRCPPTEIETRSLQMRMHLSQIIA